MRPPVQKLGVIGANRYSAPLVHWVLARGYPVVWFEKDFTSLESQLENFRTGLSQSVHAGRMTSLARDSFLSLLSGTTQFADLSGCNMVVEMNPDDPAEKMDLVSQLEDHVRPETAIGISLDTLTVTQLSAGLRYPGRIFRLRPVGMPPRSLEALEIGAGLKTDDATVQLASDFSLMLELYPALSREGPGGVVNRLLARGFSEATAFTRSDRNILSELDAELAKRGWETLPGETMNKIGRSGVRQMMSFFHRFFGHSFFLEEESSGPAAAMSRTSAGKEQGEIRTVSEIADLWILAVLNEAVQIVSENVSSWETVDRVSRMMFGLPSGKGGLLERGASRGWSVVLSGVWTVSQVTGGRLWPSPLLHLKGMEARRHSGDSNGRLS